MAQGPVDVSYAGKSSCCVQVVSTVGVKMGAEIERLEWQGIDSDQRRAMRGCHWSCADVLVLV